jgi:DNA polymerase-3 subunit delta'
MAAELHHPDLHWFFPRPRLKGGDPEPDDVRQDLAEAIAERLENGGLYAAPGGDEGMFVATVRAIVQTAALAPAMGARKVFVIGDADRLVAQEGAEYAANALLKLLEEPPADTTLILTTSEPGALLPTIRSRVAMLRVASLADDDVRGFLRDATVSQQLDLGDQSEDEIVRLAGGAPGRLIGADAWRLALSEAKRLLDAAAAHDRGPSMRVALGQSPGGARGKFSDTLDALTMLLHERARLAATRGENRAAAGAARAVDAVEEIKELAGGNVNPQLLTASLLRRLQPLVT